MDFLVQEICSKIISKAGEVAYLGFLVHPHMLRHSTGFNLANDGQDTRSTQYNLGHKNIQNTIYPRNFKRLKIAI